MSNNLKRTVERKFLEISKSVSIRCVPVDSKYSTSASYGSFCQYVSILKNSFAVLYNCYPAISLDSSAFKYLLRFIYCLSFDYDRRQSSASGKRIFFACGDAVRYLDVGERRQFPECAVFYCCELVSYLYLRYPLCPCVIIRIIILIHVVIQCHRLRRPVA